VAVTADATLLDLIEEASRGVDGIAQRSFFETAETRIFDGGVESDDVDILVSADILRVTSLSTDPDTRGAYDQAFVEDTDYFLRPYDRYPKRSLMLAPESESGLTWPVGLRRIQLAGFFGYGDGRRASPWDVLSGVSVTLAAASTTSLSDASDTILAGQTLLVGSEQMFVSAVASTGPTLATVKRGVNGTTATGHSAAAASLAIYPTTVVRATYWLAMQIWNGRKVAGFENERQGDWSYKLDARGQNALQRIIGPVMKKTVS